jgi:hypothetical protein
MFHEKIPPCAGDPSRFTLYKLKKGYRWQARRGTYTALRANDAVAANMKAMPLSSRLASAIAAILAPFISDFCRERLHASLTGRIMKELKGGRGLRLRSLAGTELNLEHPLFSLLNTSPVIINSTRHKKLRISIPLPDHFPAVKVHNKLFTGYRFIAVLVYGDLQQKQVHEISVSSPIYTGKEPAQNCVLKLDYSKLSGDYLLCLRVESYEGAQLALHPKTRAMQILAAGRLKVG